jgi:hypothetical protein
VYRGAMFSRIMFVHCPSCLGSAAAVLSAEVQCRDRVFATLACERSHAIHHFDGVMSHSFKSSPLSRDGSEPKLLKTGRCVQPICLLSQSVDPNSGSFIRSAHLAVEGNQTQSELD